MWHPIKFVAESRQIDPDALTQFAVDNKDKYAIVQGNGSVEVNTWHVDKLIKDFKNQTDTQKVNGDNNG